MYIYQHPYRLFKSDEITLESTAPTLHVVKIGRLVFLETADLDQAHRMIYDLQGLQMRKAQWVQAVIATVATRMMRTARAIEVDAPFTRPDHDHADEQADEFNVESLIGYLDAAGWIGKGGVYASGCKRFRLSIAGTTITLCDWTGGAGQAITTIRDLIEITERNGMTFDDVCSNTLKIIKLLQ